MVLRRTNGRCFRGVLMPLLLLMMMIGFGGGIPKTVTIQHTQLHEEPDKPIGGMIGAQFNGTVSLLQARPSLCFGMVIRIMLAMAMEVALDGFLKTVVTPAVAATGVGVAVAPATFLVGQALQPIIHSVAFIVFDDKFLDVSLDATGIKDKLMEGTEKGWHKMSILEGMITRYIMKSMAASCLGLAGLCTIIPVVGHVLTAWLTGWVVTWDYVYVPLSGMGHVGPLQQFHTVWQHFWDYQWFGFWAVLLEEIPLAGPTLHVYNVYRAAFFLEQLYIYNKDEDDATVSTVDSDYSMEL